MNVEDEIEILDVCLTHPKLHVHKKLLVKLTRRPLQLHVEMSRATATARATVFVAPYSCSSLLSDTKNIRQLISGK
jgi:hypothetical protein